MLLDTLNFLQNLLLPLLLGAVVVGGVAVYLVGRVGRKPPPARQRAAEAAPTAPARVAAEPAAPPAAAAAPLAPSAAPPAQPSLQPQPPAPLQPSTQALPMLADLLLVDDSAVVRAKLRRLFAPAGYRIALASDGAEALALLGEGRYALMVTDLEMPRLDGVGLIRAALALPACAGMPILAITGHEDLQSQLNQLQAVAGIYRKPWIDDDLLGHVQALVQPCTATALTAEAG